MSNTRRQSTLSLLLSAGRIDRSVYDRIRAEAAQEAAPRAEGLDVSRLARAIQWEVHDLKDEPLSDRLALLTAIAVDIGYRTGEPAMADDVMAEHASFTGGRP